MKKTPYVAFIVVALAGMTNASAQAVAARCGGACIGPFRGDDSVLQCEHIGEVTTKQIYEKGFRIMHMRDDENTVTYAMLVIEKQ